LPKPQSIPRPARKLLPWKRLPPFGTVSMLRRSLVDSLRCKPMGMPHWPVPGKSPPQCLAVLLPRYDKSCIASSGSDGIPFPNPGLVRKTRPNLYYLARIQITRDSCLHHRNQHRVENATGCWGNIQIEALFYLVKLNISAFSPISRGESRQE
jgi:hypothetical protein